MNSAFQQLVNSETSITSDGALLRKIMTIMTIMIIYLLICLLSW